jgi:hypothetical protein
MPPHWPIQAKFQTKFQTKLKIGTVDDPLEREADRVADRVLRLSEPVATAPTLISGASALQRKCSCGGSEEECDACKEKSGTTKLQRKAAGSRLGAGVPSAVDDALRSSGRPLDPASQNFFETRFARDFSKIRIHTDTQAAESARSVQSLAYTVGNQIVFGAGQYAPQTEPGRRLIAHELTHTVQQGAASVPSMQRAVTRDFDKLKDYLTRGLFDWVITDADAHKSLMILKSLNATDLKDTVAAMEKEGWVDRLFSNVSDDDSKKETDLLERINDVRVHKGKKGQADLVGSCDQTHRKELDDRVGSTKAWAREAKNRINAFAADPARHADTLKLLDTHFFHQKNNGPLTPAQQVANARQIAGNFQKVETQQNPWPTFCASPFDPECASIALAYSDSKAKRLVFCSSYFGSKPQRQVYNLLHELTHEFTGVDDRGYGDERVFAYLSSTDAMNNADSYALFAVDINDTEETSAHIRPVTRDKISDCGSNEPEVRRRFAFAARMITNALSIIGQPHATGPYVLAHFKTQDRVKLQQVIDRFKKINEKFADAIKFECEDKCGKGDTSYWRTWGSTVHLCPGWFTLSADARTDDILLTTISEELSMDFGPAVGSAAYANLSEKKAYDSATAYVGYARAVTKRFFS